jgi:hypothetical protein
MSKASITSPARIPPADDKLPAGMRQILWRLDRLERQVRKLSELVRDHAEDDDRLVKIVAEDREVLRRELVRQHQARLRLRKRVRAELPVEKLT